MAQTTFTIEEVTNWLNSLDEFSEIRSSFEHLSAENIIKANEIAQMDAQEDAAARALDGYIPRPDLNPEERPDLFSQKAIEKAKNRRLQKDELDVMASMDEEDNVIEIPQSAFKPGVLEGFLSDLQDEEYMASLGYKKKEPTKGKDPNKTWTAVGEDD